MPGKGFRTRLLIGLVVLVIAIVAAVLFAIRNIASVQEKVLPDGSVLVLRSVSFSEKHAFLHGSLLERILRSAIPSNGVAVGKFKLARPAAQIFGAPNGKRWLMAELQLAGTNAPRPTVAGSGVQFRCVIRGDRGIEFAQDFWPGKFQKYSDGYFGYVLASRYPRDAEWLWLKVESRDNYRSGGWSPVAEFKIQNKSPFHPETPSSTRVITNVSLGDLSFVLDTVTVATQAFRPDDIWNHVVTAQFQVNSNGLPLTNWGHPYVFVEDASGNWDYNLASHRSLDPRYIWKLTADFEPASDLPKECTLKMPLPTGGTTVTTNFANLPVSISWDGYSLDASIPTNNPNIALRYVSVWDREGNEAGNASGSWNQYMFRKGSFIWRKNGGLTMAGQPASLALAIVTNVHATFYVQPVLLPAKSPK